jgi:hypothetical protein
LEPTSPGLLGDSDRIGCPLIISDEWRPWFAPPCWGRFLERSGSAATWLISSNRPRVRCGRSRTWSIRRFADWDRCDLLRHGSASCDSGTPGRVAGVSESVTVPDEHRPRTCEPPAPIAGVCRTRSRRRWQPIRRLGRSEHAALPGQPLFNIAHIPEIAGPSANVCSTRNLTTGWRPTSRLGRDLRAVWRIGGECRILD